jgi:protein O-GlcNAc transferase
LRTAASSRGVDATRLCFAPPEPVPDYLARLPLCDVFLDTAPFGSHTSVNDALFMRVPVITIAGRSFAGRASASQLVAAGLEGLVTRDLGEYVDMARALIRDRARLLEWRARMDSVRASALFDADGYAARFGEAVAALAASG